MARMPRTIAEQRQWLESCGFIVGARDPKRNTAFNGAFMVAADPLPDGVESTEDARHYGFCVVSDNLNECIRAAFEASYNYDE